MYWLKYIMALEKIKAMQAGTKSKEKNGKLGKVRLSRRDTNSTINPDLSNLRKPIDTSISTLYHISKLLEDGTEEIKSILTYECDIIYECRICHSLFRSIVNFISHKREYCREKFNITLHRNMWDDLNTIYAIGSAIDTCQAEQTIIKSNLTNDRILRSQASKETCKKDLTAVIDTLIKKQEDMRSNSSNESKIEAVITDASSNQHIYLRAIETNGSAVYQTIKSSDTVTNVHTDLTANKVMELQNTMEQNSSVLEEYRNENQSEKSDSLTQADPSDEENKLPADRILTNSLVCVICNAKFSTKKTLTFHMRTLHTSQRMYYSCPCCANMFANTWSVHRHLFKVHKKNHEQVRKLRLKIQEIPFDMRAIATQDLKKSRATRIFAPRKIKYNNNLENSDKVQEEISYLESDMENSNCNECGKKFDTKTALSAHSQHCQALIAACDQVTTKINVSDSSTSSDLVLNNNTLCDLKNTDASRANSEHTSSSSEIINECLEAASTHLQYVSTISKEDWNTLECYNDHPSKRNSSDNNNIRTKIAPLTIHQNSDDSEPQTIEPNRNLQPSMIVNGDTSETNSVDLEVVCKKSNTLNHSSEKRTNLKRKSTIPEKNIIRVQQEDSTSLWLSETERNLSMENKMAAIANLRKLQCLLCKRKFTSMTSLRRHMAIHIGWYRYRCKLCDFKCFFKCDCVVHCNKVHNAQNNHAFMAEVVIEIPQDEHRLNENMITDVTDVEKKKRPDDADRTISSSQSKIREDDANACAVEKDEKATTTNNTTNVSARDTDETATICTNLEEYMENRTSGKLNVHSDLKRMVMEVIFGSSDAENAAERADSERKLSDVNDEAEKDTQSNNNENSAAIASADDTGLAYCSTTDGSKPQRPMRKRIKPLSKDFIYDLKDIQLRRETWKGPTSFQLGKSSAKHHLNSCNSETLVNARKKAKLHSRALNSN